MEIPSKYDPKKVEDHWYTYWMKNEYFSSKPDDREPYTIVIPPPNVTGVLHMGHMLNNTIQDVLIRRARLKGKNACWVPGMDHASIATEAKVVAKLKEEGISKADLTREEFLKHAWDWTNEYGGVILEQLKKLGCSCDWDRTAFTLDDNMSASVIKVFVDLFNKGQIYRGYRMVNWDPEAKTTLSDEEVNHEERQGLLYYLSYAIEGSDEKVRVIPIIEDDYVDLEFGTGCLKVTPAHDSNDYALGEKHKLATIDIFNDDATLNSFGLHYEGQDRFVARKAIAKELEEKGFLVKTEQHINKVGTSERTKAVIEPRLSDQWFLNMEELVKPALRSVLETQEVKLFPKKFENTYRHWMENIRNWNISRQLWWGQQIPAYYYGDGKDDFVVAESKEEALKLAQTKANNTHIKITDLKQDEDALDTWFSSWLWPISVFNGILEPDNAEINYYYPTNDLITGPDILFFWVARMIISGYEYRQERPFENVYLTGLVRDKQRRKMSGVRVGLLLSSAAGNDLMFDEALCQQGKNFANKIWNAFRLVKGWEVSAIPQPESAKLGLAWYTAKFNETLATIEDHFSKYRISDALMATYKLVWDDFCSWLLEIVKPAYQQPIDQRTYDAVITLFEDNLKILHPFMPFLTEEVWQRMGNRTKDEALIVASWPKLTAVDETLIKDFDFAAEVISGVRTIRKEKNIPMKEALALSVLNKEGYGNAWDVVIAKLTNLAKITAVDEALEGALSFRVKSNEYFIPMEGAVDIDAEIKKIKEELNYTQGFLGSVNKKLGNERFVNNAPEQVVAIEKKKAADAEAKINTLQQRLASLE